MGSTQSHHLGFPHARVGQASLSQALLQAPMTRGTSDLMALPQTHQAWPWLPLVWMALFLIRTSSRVLLSIPVPMQQAALGGGACSFSGRTR